MNVKRLTAAVTAVLMSAGALSLFPVSPVQRSSADAVLVDNDFDVTYNGWYNCGDQVTLTPDETIVHGGTRSMLVANRLSAEDGVESAKGLYLDGGQSYNYNVFVYHNSGSDEEFKLTLTYLCKDGETYETKELLTQTVSAGQWTKLETSFKAPKGASEFIVKLATNSTCDFNFDDFTVTGKQTAPVNVVSAAGKGLKDEFANYFRVGNILNGGTVNNTGIKNMILENYNSIECENETKPDATLVQSQCSNSNIGVSLRSASSIFDFCAQNNIAVRGHAFVWHSQTPSWFFKDNFQNNGNWVSSSVMDQRLESYIKNMFQAIKTQYPTLNLYAYDVCNECISDDSSRTGNGKDGAREAGDNNTKGGTSAWVSVYGNNSFVEKAFTYAHKYKPEGCDLYYNDYNEYWDHKRDCIYNMCKNLYNKGLLDGVGMQSHINADSNGFSGTAAYVTAMKKYLSIGCDVQVTELDISTESGKFSAQQQASKYKDIFQAAVDCNKSGEYKGRVSAVCIWGPNDANTWIKTENAPLLHDTNNQPKAAYNTLISLLPASEWGDGNNPAGSTPAAPPEVNSEGYWFHDTFEGSTCDWSARGGCSVETSGRQAYAGKEALLISERTDAWNGGQKSLSTRIFEPGKEYSFSVNFLSLDGPSEVEYKLTLQYEDASGETQYDMIAQVVGGSGEYVQLANTNYKIPSGASNLVLVAETTEEICNIYIDEAIAAPGGTKIDGPGSTYVSPTDIKGDLDFDSRISVADLVLLKSGLIEGFSKSSVKKNADVTRNNKVDAVDAMELQKYLLGITTEFMKEEVEIDLSKFASMFSGMSISESYKKDTENNPLYTQRFGADPGWMVYKDRLYVYTTNDAFEYKNGSLQENSYDVWTINCCSTSDLVNWTDHGAIPVAGRRGATSGAASWANNSWAPDAAWKNINGKDQFFLYFADNGSGIGVLTADSPTGPFKDPLGKQLISRSTPNCGNVAWLFDPGVYYDQESGKGYIAFGGGKNNDSGTQADPGTGRMAQLGDDMISIVGSAKTIHPPYLFEDSSLIKIGANWIYSFCHNWSVPGGTSVNGASFGNADIGYMVGTDPMGDLTYKGVAFKNTGSQRLDNGGNNHHSIIEFKGEYYVLYHSRQLEMRMGVNGGKGLNYRSPCIDKATVNGTSISCNGSQEGVKQIETLNPYVKVQAETMSNQSKGISVNGLSDTTVVGKKGEWIKVSGVKFDKGASTIKARVSSKSGGAIKVCTNRTGDAATYIECPAGQFTEVEMPVVGDLSGTTDLYFVFSGDIEFDWWQFS